MRRELTKLREEKDKLGDTSKLIPELTAELNTHQAELTEIQATVNALEKEEMRYQQLNLDLNTLKSNLKRKKVQLDKQKSECDALGDPTSLIQSLTDELKHRHDELANLTEKQAALQVYEEQYVNYNNEYDKVRNILRVRRNELDKIRHQIDSIGDVSKLIDDLTLQRDTNMQKLAALNTKLEALEPYERDYIPIKQKLDELQRQYAEKLKHVHGGEVELKNLKLQLDELKKKEAELADTERAIDYLRETLEIYTILREHIFHRKGVVMYAINQLLPHLEIVTSRLLAELTDSRLTGVKLEAYEESKGYGIRIQVLGTDKSWRDIREFSGGERTQINAALRFAIAKELVGLPTVGRTYSRMKTLFIDEGDLGSLDTESSRQLFVKKLFDMKKFFDKVILITHLTEVADQFPYQIRITMTPEQESRVVMGGR
jgi:DNA repair exonuclease SbcCD ATPase subunit